MTKAIRVENADTSSHKVVVYVEQKNAAGDWVRRETASKIPLDYPTQMMTEYVHSGQRLVIEEVIS